MVFSCKNCGKRYRIEPSLYEIHPVRFICRKCAQEHIIHKSDNAHEVVVAVGGKGSAVKSTTREFSTIQLKSEVVSHATINPGASDSWYITIMGQRQGPLTRIAILELLTSKKITNRTFVWRAPMGSWVRLRDLAELADLVAEAEQIDRNENEKTVMARLPDFTRDRSPSVSRPANPFDNPDEFNSNASGTSPTSSTGFNPPVPPVGEAGSGHRKTWVKQLADQKSEPAPVAAEKRDLADELFKGLDSPRIDIRRASEIQDEEPLIVPMAQRRQGRHTTQVHDPDKTQVTWAYHDDESIIPPTPHPTESALQLHELGHLANKMDSAHRRKLLTMWIVGGILALVATGSVIAAVMYFSPEKPNTSIKPQALKSGVNTTTNTKPVEKKVRALPDTAILKTLNEQDEVQITEGTDVIKVPGRVDGAPQHNHPAPANALAADGTLPAKAPGAATDLLVEPKVRTSTQELARVNSDVKVEYAKYGKLLESGTGHVDKEVKVEPKTVSGMGNQQMDTKKINDFFLGKMGQFRGCRASMSRQVDSTIDINLSFILMKSGQISNLVIVPVGVHDPKLVQCMKSIVAGWIFPQQGMDTEFRTKFGI